MTLTPSTAILLFSRTATAEAAGKSFGYGVDNQRVATALLRRTERILGRTGLPVLRSNEYTQTGRTFGERLAAAVTTAFAAGYERLLVVGNDCPFLSPLHLRAAARMLTRGRTVIGPDRRGGTWLLGLQRSVFNAQRFAALSWETAGVCAELRALFPAAAVAPTLGDINALSDLRRAWPQLRSRLASLQKILFGNDNVPQAAGPRRPTRSLLRRAGRAPPVG